MKDFISKATFGFLMAQLLPGAVVVFAFTCLFSDSGSQPSGLGGLIVCTGEWWFESTFRTILFLFVATSIGMLVHALNWTVLAWLEHNYKSSRESFWHKRFILLQVFLSPVKMLLEILWLLVAPDIDSLTMEENIHKIADNHMDQFSFLQDFYLYFGQFYAHTAYALLTTTVLSLVCQITRPGHTPFTLTIGLYFLTSLFFLLGRVQLGSLFKAERALSNKSSKGNQPTTVRGQSNSEGRENDRE